MSPDSAIIDAFAAIMSAITREDDPDLRYFE
jgi:hypothetical protein